MLSETLRSFLQRTVPSAGKVRDLSFVVYMRWSDHGETIQEDKFMTECLRSKLIFLRFQRFTILNEIQYNDSHD